METRELKGNGKISIARTEVDVPYREKLNLIREALEGEAESVMHLFSHGNCIETSRIVYQLLGIEEIAGLCTLGEDFLTGGHSWNYDPKRKLYIDLTLDQFSDQVEKVSILPESVDFLIPNDEDTIIQKEWVVSQKVEGLIARLKTRIRV